MSIFDELKERNFQFKKQFGQNFISDSNLLASIVKDANISSDDIVLEIGTGAGTLTEEIARNAKYVHTYEIDNTLYGYLDDKFSGKNIALHKQDIMKINNNDIFKECGFKDYKVVANLPYYITSLIVMKFLETDIKPISMTLMVQKEVAERYTAKENTKNYSAITAAIALYGSVSINRIVSRKLFKPMPDVDSAIITIRISPKKLSKEELGITRKIIHSAFLRRRKTLINNLMSDLGENRELLENVLDICNVDKSIRGEALSVDQFIEISKAYLKVKESQ